MYLHISMWTMGLSFILYELIVKDIHVHDSKSQIEIASIVIRERFITLSNACTR